MKIKSILNKRNFKHFFNLNKFYPKSVKNYSKDYSSFNSFRDIGDYFEIQKYYKIIVVASGPSSKNIENDENAIYITTNRGLKLVRNDFIYVVNDYYYMVKYLKNFKENYYWKGTIFFPFLTEKELKSSEIKLLKNYLNNKSRSKNEFFISNFQNKIVLNEVFNDFLFELNSILGRSFYRVNSGFSIVLLAYLFSIKYNLELDIYGLDMGEGEGSYFDDKIAKLGHSVNGNFSKKEVSDFFDIVYKKDTEKKIKNFSYFKNRI